MSCFVQYRRTIYLGPTVQSLNETGKTYKCYFLTNHFLKYHRNNFLSFMVFLDWTKQYLKPTYGLPKYIFCALMLRLLNYQRSFCMSLSPCSAHPYPQTQAIQDASGPWRSCSPGLVNRGESRVFYILYL